MVVGVELEAAPLAEAGVEDNAPRALVGAFTAKPRFVLDPKALAWLRP